jgi:hypothetical protein
VAGLQFDLLYDPLQLQFVAIDAGPSAVAAQKAVNFNLLKAGHLRVIIAGLNRNSLKKGAVAVCRFSRGGTGAVRDAFGLQDVILSDPAGFAVDVLVVNGPLNESAQPVVNRGPGGLAAAARYGGVLLTALVAVAALLWLTRRTKPKARRHA